MDTFGGLTLGNPSSLLNHSTLLPAGTNIYLLSIRDIDYALIEVKADIWKGNVTSQGWQSKSWNLNLVHRNLESLNTKTNLSLSNHKPCGQQPSAKGLIAFSLKMRKVRVTGLGELVHCHTTSKWWVIIPGARSHQVPGTVPGARHVRQESLMHRALQSNCPHSMGSASHPILCVSFLGLK